MYSVQLISQLVPCAKGKHAARLLKSAYSMAGDRQGAPQDSPWLKVPLVQRSAPLAVYLEKHGARVSLALHRGCKTLIDTISSV